MKKTKTPSLQFVLLSLAILSLTAFSGCITGGMSDSADAAKASLQKASVAGSGPCATNAFRLVVHGTLMNACQQCHGSAQGSSNPQVAYQAVKARVNLGNISGSSIINRASQSGHCGSCGSALGSTLNSQMRIWAKAEAGDPATCAEYSTASLPTNVSVPPFDLGAYVPPNPNDTIVVQDGLNEFRAAGGVHSILVANCAQCHKPGGLSSAAPFAVNDATVAYRESKPRANFGEPTVSLLYQRARIVGHGGGGCTICGNPTFVSNFLSELNAWAARENSAVSSSIVTLSAKDVTVTGTGTQTLNWALDAESTPAQSSLSGATLTLKVSLANSSTWRFISPTLRAGNRSVRVKKISFVLNNQLQSTVSSYFNVDTRVSANTTKDLASFPALVPIPASGSSLRLEFDILEGE